jgi:nitroreductase
MMSLKRLIWKLTPEFTHRWIRNIYFVTKLLPNIWYDNRRFLLYSGINKSQFYRGEQAARITMAYHQLEKGLSYATPRLGFGKDVIERLFGLLIPFIKQHGYVEPATTAVGVLTAYVNFNEAAGLDLTNLKARISALTNDDTSVLELCNVGGSIAVDRKELKEKQSIDFRGFFNSRHSVRNFSGGIIPEADIIEAVRISQKTPSVCNRQAWKVHAYSNDNEKSKLLEIQAGSRGFGDRASTVLVVTCDLTCFVDVAERYQAWIDGGMFSMSLCLAFHSLGYGTCCLNWSKEYGDDVALRKAANLQSQEQIIMLIAVGTLPETFNVAYSTRRPIQDVLQIH